MLSPNPKVKILIPGNSVQIYFLNFLPESDKTGVKEKQSGGFWRGADPTSR
jgi:hypothetical protein